MIGIFYRHRRHWILLGCIIFSLGLISTQETAGSVWLQHHFSSISKFLLSPYRWIISQKSLREELTEFRSNNVALQSQVARFQNFESENERLRSILNFQRHYNIDLIAGQVIGVSQSPRQDILRVDVGKNKGVIAGMAAISYQGVVGKVVSVTQKYSDIQLLGDPYFKISVKIENSSIKGILHSLPFGNWRIENISPGTVVEKGELVLTSGYSKIFPSDLRVGIVTAIKMDQVARFQNIIVEPTAELRKLEEVFILNWIRKDNE